MSASSTGTPVQDGASTDPPAGRLPRRQWPSLSRWGNSRFGAVFGADLRSLAVFRMAMALIVIMDVVARLSSIRAQYTEDGVMPRTLLVEGAVRWRWSLNLINDTYAFQLGLMLLTILAAMGMLLGYRTRMMTIVVWILIVSLQARNPFVLSGADSLLRVLLFWAMFLPLGAKWSVDASRAQPVTAKVNLSFATIGLFLQIAFMYWFTAALKSSPAWRSDGTALQYALSANHITRPFGEYLVQFPDLLRFLTHASLAIEVVAPILLFSPFLTGPIRTIGIALIVSLHVGIYLTMDVGIFPWTSALCMAAFLPAWFWDTLMPKLVVHMPIQLRKAGQRLRAVPATITDSLVVRRRQLAGMPFMATASAAEFQPSVTYSQANATPTTSAPDSVKAGQGSVLGLNPIANVFLAGCIVFVFLWNWTSVSDYRMPASVQPFAYGTGLYQKWNMFAPSPSRATVWVVVRGVLADGREVDLLTPIVHDDLTRVPQLSWQQPDDIAGGYYGNKYWRKYFTAIIGEQRQDERRTFAAFVCRSWNGYYGGDVRLVGLQIYRMSERTMLDQEDVPIVRSKVAQYRCT